MITFILNNQTIKTDSPSGMSLLNFIRNEAGLKGTKSGCKEGDCGACTVLAGTLSENKVDYKTIVSCLTPLGNAHGKHIVTVEGLNTDTLSPVQHEIIDNAGTQCGFCTPGFIVSLTGYSLRKDAGLKPAAIASIAGNICRCTGYKSIEKAAEKVADLLKTKDNNHQIEWLTNHHFVPDYFKTIADRLKEINKRSFPDTTPDLVIGGGTDLMVQQPNNVKVSVLNLLAEHDVLKEIKQVNNKLILGASVTVNDLLESAIMLRHFNKLPTWFKLISSEQIRNMATLAGNFVNASPIGDMSIFFLALNSKLTVADKEGLKRTIALKEFFLDYKKLDLKENEIIRSIEFELPDNKSHFNFEKVSKRLHLDIASVNSAIKIKMDGDIIKDACLSAGGIGPIPAFLSKTSSFLAGKPLTIETLFQAEKVIQGEIRPISDVRGSESYKRLLLRQLFFTHFIEMFPDAFAPDTLLSALQTV